jgi:peptidoglycan/LPS O-acetylase OafA/YrhL
LIGDSFSLGESICEFALVRLARRLKMTSGRPSGFDYMRLGLSLMVAFVHFRGASRGGPANPDWGFVAHPWSGPWAMPVRPFGSVILPMFFALSGFLVAGSLERSKTLLTFLGLRVIRIYPALAVEVLLSALLIGPAVTALPLASYFRDPVLWHYFLNTIGDIHYVLPGVFENNPWPKTVNAQLWTVPVELMCYITLAALVVIGAVQRKILIPLAAAAFSVAHFVMLSSEHDWLVPVCNGPLTGPILVFCFLAGVSVFLYRDRLLWSFPLFLIALTASAAFLFFVPLGEYLAVWTMAYVTVYLGLTDFKRIFFINGADYSYGIYIYHFVVGQAFVYAAAPSHWWITAVVCIPLTALVAAFSWHAIEKPAQKWRSYLPAAERHYLALKASALGWPRAT